jgi:class 3 adenylate cyclase
LALGVEWCAGRSSLDGKVKELQGDAMIAGFGAPVAREDLLSGGYREH